MRRLFALLILMAAATAPATAQHQVVGYYPAWTHATYPHTAIRYDLLTHIAHAFIWPNPDGSLLTQGHWTAYPAMVQAAHAAGVKVVIAVGGWGETLTPNFSTMAANPTARANFVANLVGFVETHGYDGVDLDWEYPRAADRANVVALVKELKAALVAENPDCTLSLAMPSSNWAGGYDVHAIQPYADWFGIMTYDYHGGWTSHAGHNAPLYHPSSDPEGSANSSVSAWLNEGMAAAKMNLGIPLYGYRFTAAGLYQPRTGAVPSITYHAAEALRASGWTYTWDATARVPYLQNPEKTQFVTYEDTVSARGKVEYVQARGLNGVILWAIQHDYDAGNPSKGQPLLETIGARLVDRSSTPTGEGEMPPGAFRLGQNHPNPFDGHTVVAFEAPTTSRVTIRVFNTLGTEVARLADRVFAAGHHEVAWDAGALPAGLYVCSFEAGGVRRYRPMVLVR